MRNRLIAVAMAIILAWSTVSPLGQSMALAQGQADISEGKTNLALGKSVEVSSSYVGSGWKPELAVDGKRTGINTASGDKGWTSQPFSGSPHPEWIIIDLNQSESINKVVLWPRNDEGTNVGVGFPIDFTIQVSTDKVNWTTVTTETYYPKPIAGGAQTFTFTPQSAKYVKVEGTVLSKDDFQVYAMQLAEVEVYQAASQLSDADAVDAAIVALDLTGTSGVIGDIQLPKYGAEGTDITWSSSNPSFMTNDGKLLKSPTSNEGDLTLTMTATVMKGTVRKTKDFTITLKALQANLALGQKVEVSSSYVGSGWNPEYAVDGKRTGINTATGEKGWTSKPASGTSNPEWIMIDLNHVDSIDKVVLWPRDDAGTNVGLGFPIDFTIQVSPDKVNWTTVATKTNYPAPALGGAQTIAFNSVYARYVKIEGTKLAVDNFNTYVMQLVEVEIYQAISHLSDEDAVNEGLEWLSLNGSTDVFTNMQLPTFSMENTQVTWESSNPAYLRGDGKLMKRPAWNEGSLTVTLTATVTKGNVSKTKAFPVTVKPYPNVAPEPPDTFKVAVFWPPTKDYVNAEQYDYLKEANVNYVEVVETGDLTSVEINDRMLDLAGERGIKVSVTNTEDLSSVSDKEIEDFVNHYKPHPATGGYFVRDEPVALKDFQDSERIFKKIKSMDPARLPHLNLLPGSDHWATWTGLVGASNIDYLTFDSYPFGVNGMGQDFYYLLDRIRKMGLSNNYKTAGYLQSVGIDNRLVRPTPEIIRYEVYLNLAYGLKKLTWFTWWTPTERGEPFTTAIITADGQKTDLFEPVKQMNKVIQELGSTLLKLDAKDVYHYGQIPPNTEQLPASFYFQPVSAPNANDDMLITNFVHKDTGRRYVMVVNKSMTESKNFTFAINSNMGIRSVTEVSKETGEEMATNFDPATSELSASFLPGEGRLYAMPETFIRPYPVQAPVSSLNNPSQDNLAFGKKASASSDTGIEWGWNAAFVTDGKRNSTPASYGWSNSLDLGVDHKEWITIDLGTMQEVGAVSLFPRTDQWHEGTGFPVGFNIQVSNDNVNWTTVHTTQNYTERPATTRNISFPAVNARYVKVEATELGKDDYNYYRMQFAEIEVYKDASAFSNLRAKMLPSDMYVGSQGTLSLGRLQLDGSLQAVSGPVRFASSNPSIVAVNAQGVVTGVAAGSAAIAVTVPGLNGGTETNSFPILVKELASPWTLSFVGGADGKVELQQNGSYRVWASGTGMGAADDQFVYVNKSMASDQSVTLTSNIDSLYYAGASTAGLSGRTGIMIRSTSTNGSSQPASVYLSVNAEGRTELSYRNEEGTITTIDGDYVKPSVELKLEKQGNTVTGYYKKGTEWLPINANASQSSITVSLAETLTGGIAAYSGAVGAFSDSVGVTVTEVNHVAPSDDARLKGIALGGSPLQGFDAGKTGYDVQLPAGTTAVPTVTATAMDEKAKVTVTQADSTTGKAVIEVTAEDGVTQSTYEIRFSVASSGNSSGSDPGTDPHPGTNPNTGTDQQPATKPNAGTGTGTGTGQPSSPGSGTKLTDVPDRHWAADSIRKAVQLGIVNGYGDGTFKPDKQVNRAEFIVMLARALKLPENASTAVAFTDADKMAKWALPYIAQAEKRGLVSGYSDGTFRPDATITRAEMAVLIFRAAGLQKLEEADKLSLPFADADGIPAWALPYVAALTNVGLINGTDGNRFDPEGIVTRAQAVTIIIAMLNRK